MSRNPSRPMTRKAHARAALLAAAALTGTALVLGACGKQADLETAPPLFGDEAKSSWSASSASASPQAMRRETERALPDANGPNRSPDPYRNNVKVSQAPLEGFGNAQRH
jgi:hypothetical protein